MSVTRDEGPSGEWARTVKLLAGRIGWKRLGWRGQRTTGKRGEWWGIPPGGGRRSRVPDLVHNRGELAAAIKALDPEEWKHAETAAFVAWKAAQAEGRYETPYERWLVAGDAHVLAKCVADAVEWFFGTRAP